MFFKKKKTLENITCVDKKTDFHRPFLQILEDNPVVL